MGRRVLAKTPREATQGPVAGEQSTGVGRWGVGSARLERAQGPRGFRALSATPGFGFLLHEHLQAILKIGFKQRV